MIKQLASFLLLSALQAERPMEKEQQVVVAVQLDAAGRVLEAKAESGNPSLYKRAIEAAKKAKYAPDCDDRGRPVGSSTKVFAFFDERGKFLRVQFPIMAASTLVGNNLVKKVDPEYPEHLKRAGVDGLVILQVWVDAEGRVTRAEVLRGHPSLAEHAVKAVLQWRYKPTFMRCERVPVISTVAIPFGGP